MRYDINYPTDRPNINGRIYPRDVVLKALSEANMPILGTLGVPDNPTEIPADKLAFVIVGFKETDEGVIMQAELLDTPAGKILLEAISS